MENKQFTSDDSSNSPYSHQGFQTDRFTKRTNNLNIPDTIPENCSAELSGELPKMEVPQITVETYDSGENKENVSYNQQVFNNEPLNRSENLAIDSLYIKQCEKKLLDNSFNDEEKNSEFDNKVLVGRHLLEIQSNSAYLNDTISTPPSLLRKEISMLRKEMAEAHEFHDFEIKVLREERHLDGVDPEKYIELFEKYSTLIELYANLKTELDEYRKNQESVRNELQSKTADYLESLCSQIETSDNSLNFSSSFVSFSGGVKNSTMVEEASEVEATVVHDGTVLANDPLSITVDNGNGTFKTPLHTPLKSAKKLFPEEWNSFAGKRAVEMKDSAVKGDLALESEYNIHLLNLETAFYGKVKEVEDLEQRLFKVEDMSVVLHSEFERITSVYEKDSTALKEELSVKTEQLNDIIQKLFTETISLNPSLRDSLTDMPGTKLLGVFLETIMENCKKIQNDDQLTTIENLRNQLSSQEIKLTELEVLRTTCEDLTAKLADLSSTISTRDDEIKMLQSHATNVRQTREDLASANESLRELDSKLKTIEAEKTAVENKCRDLEKVEETLSFKLEESQTQLASAKKEKSQIENENSRLRESHEFLKVQIMEIEDILKSRETEMVAVKENLMKAESSVQQLQSQLNLVQDEKAELQKVCEQLQEKNESLQVEIKAAKNPENIPAFVEVQTENDYLKQQILESEKRLAQLKIELENDRKLQVEALMQELEEVQKEKTRFSKALENSESSVQQLQSQLNSVQDEKAELQKVCEQLQEKNESLQVEVTAAKNPENNPAFEKLQTENDYLKQQILESEKHLAELKIELENDKKLQVEALMQELEEVQKEKTRFSKALESSESSVQQLHSQLNSVQDEKAELQKVCEQLQEKNESLQDEIAAAKNPENIPAFVEVQTENDYLKQQILESEKHLAELKIELENDKKLQVEALMQELEEVQKEKTRFSKALESSESSVQHLQLQLNSIEDEKAELQKVCEQLQEKNESLQDEIAAAIYPENIVAFEKLQTENDYLKQQILESEKHLAELKIELENDKKLQVEALMQELEEVQKEKTRLSKALESSESSVQQLQLYLNSIEDEKAELQKVCEQLQEKNESLQVEITAAINPENIIAFEKLQTENDYLKHQILESENHLSELKFDLENIRKLQVEALMREVEEVKKENVGYSKSLENLEKSQKLLSDLLIDLGSDSDLTCERITNLMQKVSLQDSLDAREAKIMSGFVETITKTCKNVENEFIRNFEDRKSEWEDQRNLDLKTIKSLEDEVKLLVETRGEGEARLKEIILEKEDILKKHEDLNNQMMEAKRMVSSCNEEIKSLRSQEEVLKKAKDDLSQAEKVIAQLNDQLLGVKTEKTAAENKCRDLETIWESLSLKYEESQTKLASAKEEKSQIENEYSRLKESHDSLKVQITETETTLKSRESEIVAVKENLLKAESSVQELQVQLKSVEDEKTELHKAYEQLKGKNESLQDEIRAVKNTANNPDFQKVQIENDYLKQQILESQKHLAELNIELENVRKVEVEALMREVEEVKKESTRFSKSLENVERGQKFLAEFLSDPENNSDYPHEIITKLIENATALKESLDGRETKIMSGFVETITKTCKNVENELIRNFEGKKSEWEDQRDVDLKKIKNLEDDIKLLKEKRKEGEVRLKETIMEKEDLMRLHEELKNQMMEVERMVSSCNEEIKSLRSQEEVFKKAKDDLSQAEEVIAQLNDQLLGVKTEKTAAETKCRDLETVRESLSLKLEESQTQLASAKEEKSQIENEYSRLKESHDSLKVQLTETETTLKSRESEIVAVKENLLKAESSVQELQVQLKSVEDEKTELHKVCEQLKGKNESLQVEITAAKNPENIPAFVEVQTENDYLKQQILESQKHLAELNIELENVRKVEVEALMSEVEEVRKENSTLSKALENMEGCQKLLSELLTDVESDSDLPCDRITNLLENASALKESLGAREAKIMSGFIETITKTIKNVQNELMKNFEGKKCEWEDQRNLDLKIIKSLEGDIKLLKKKKKEGEARLKEIILEKEDLMQRHEDLKKQVMEAERMVSRCNEEINSLRSQEEVFKKAKNDLSEAEEVIARLSHELSTVKSQKSEAEQRCRELEDGAIKTQMDGLKAENKNLKLGNDSLKDRVKQLTKIIDETAGSDLKEDHANTSTSLSNGMNLRNKSVKRADRYARRLDKLEEINHNLTELVIRILTATEYPDLEKLNLSSVRDFPKTMKKVLHHLDGFLSKLKELREENSQLDEECETYSNIIKDLKKEAAAVWKSNVEKTEAMEAEIARLNEEKLSLENGRQDLLAKLSRLDDECQKLQSAPKTEGHHTCTCGNDSKKVNELKRTILMKEHKLLEMQDLKAQTNILNSQLEYLKTALDREKRKAAEEKEKNKKLQNQLKEATKSEKKSEDNQVLEELRMRGSITGGIVQEFGDKEKMKKLSKDIGILKELCRARYAEIKRLEAVNAALRSAAPKNPATPKNSNQMDSPIRSRGYNTRSKYQVREVWKTEIIGKENGGV